MNFQWRVSIKSTAENVMCNGNKLMYERVTRSESWLLVAEKVNFEKVKAICLTLFFVCVCWNYITFFHSSGRTPCWRQFLYLIDRGLVISKLHNFTISIEIPSWPWTFCEFKPLINFETFPHSISKSLSLFWV